MKVIVALLLSNDLLVDIFKYYDRRQLAKLEAICRRFHGIVFQFFNKRPFLVLELECHLDEKRSRFSKVLSAPDTEDENCAEMVYILFISQNFLWNCDAETIFQSLGTEQSGVKIWKTGA